LLGSPKILWRRSTSLKYGARTRPLPIQKLAPITEGGLSESRRSTVLRTPRRAT